MKHKLILITVVIFLSSCSNKIKDDNSKLNLIRNSTLLLIGSTKLSIIATQTSCLLYYENLELFNLYYQNNFEDISFSQMSYFQKIDKLIKKIEKGESINKKDISSIQKQKRDILISMKNHAIFDNHDRIEYRSFLLKSPRNKMLIIPKFDLNNNDLLIEQLYYEKLNFACLYYSYSNLWYPSHILG